MPSSRTKRSFYLAAILVAASFISGESMMAQVVSSANVKVSIVKADIAILSLSSANGTQFRLQTGAGSCYDINVDGLQTSLEGNHGKQQVSYSLNLDDAAQSSAGITKINLDVSFSEPAAGIYQATDPYTLCVNYN